MMMSVTASLRSAAGEFCKQGFAELGAALAAVLCEEKHEVAKRIYVGTLDEVAPPLLRLNEPSLSKHGKVRGEGALGQA